MVSAITPTRRITISVELTNRETEVLDLIVEGASNKAIADRLKISDHTAKFHVMNALQKLGTDNRTRAAALWAVHRAKERAALPDDKPCARCEAITAFMQSII